MKKIICELWNGNIAPIKQCGDNDTEIKNLLELIETNEEKLLKVLDEKQKTLLEKYILCIDEYSTIMLKHAFCEGFCLSSKLLSEALSANE